MAQHHVKVASALALIDWPRGYLDPVPSSARVSVFYICLGLFILLVAQIHKLVVYIDCASGAKR